MCCQTTIIYVITVFRIETTLLAVFSDPVAIFVAFGTDKVISCSSVFILVFLPRCFFVGAKVSRTVFCGTTFPIINHPSRFIYSANGA